MPQAEDTWEVPGSGEPLPPARPKPAGNGQVEEWLPEAFAPPVAAPAEERPAAPFAEPGPDLPQKPEPEPPAPPTNAHVMPPAALHPARDPELERMRDRIRLLEGRVSQAEQRAARAEERAEAAEERAEAAEEAAAAAQESAEAAEEGWDGAEERANLAERELASLRERAEAMKRAAAQEAAARYPTSAPAEVASGPLGLNEITFEALRELGLSVNQAARFLGQRDQRHGLRAVEDVDRFLGLPGDIKDK